AEPLRDAARPYTIIARDGLKVGVIGMANFSSLSSISSGDGGLGITVLENVQVVQSYIDILRPQVNVIVCVTHLGLGEDEELIRRTRGLDIVFGGHLHIVLNPPKNIPDLDGRFVPLVHSGAFLKYIGRFDGAFTATSPVNPYDRGMTCNGPDDCLSGRCDAGLCRCDSDADCAGATRCAPTLDEESFGRTEGEGKVCRAVEEHNYELESFDYEVIPIDNTLPEDAEMAMLMDPWERELSRLLDLRKVIGYTPQPLRRFGPSGGDSPLGNFLSDTMAYRSRVEADFSATNSLGIRTDINRGPITMDQMYNVFPFPNTISTMTLSGNEVQELFDYNTYRSTGRGCATQLQVGGIEYELDCDTATKEVERTLDEGRVYEFEFRDSSVKYAKNIKVIRGACRNVNECALPSISDCSDSSGAVCNLEEGADIGSCRCRELVQPQFYYKFSTNNYMATGGSGFTILRFNTTQKDSGVDLREAAVKAIEQSPKCIDRCAEKMGDLFDRERLSTCATMAYCLADMTAYESRMCRALEKFSARDYCAENAGAGFCLGSSTTSNFERCLQANYSDCEDYFFLDQIEACRLREEADKKRCAAESKSSPRVDCLNTHAPQCLDASTYDPISPFDECRAFARVKAEELCPVLPCPEANADGRQKAIRPRNEATDGGGGGGTPVSIMEALQDAGFDACY
ncbi:MAG: 5'-nucleotidase C-terminal domain-containing protein, partial [Myxococcota bacterium]|nr:5'-nucleotidase C-terminal domain-containing protein [Myxococcota bacterium]